MFLIPKILIQLVKEWEISENELNEHASHAGDFTFMLLSPGSTTVQLWQKPLWWWSVCQSFTPSRSDHRKTYKDNLHNRPTRQKQWKQLWESESAPSWFCCEVRNKIVWVTCSYVESLIARSLRIDWPALLVVDLNWSFTLHIWLCCSTDLMQWWIIQWFTA